MLPRNKREHIAVIFLRVIVIHVKPFQVGLVSSVKLIFGCGKMLYAE